ncbi:sensor histidine kinase [Cellulomonas soli]|uniref:sensor histidine kinase n=1 Tax=Cellulomonas soli TaxID=931535 RepID=UPI003F842DAA
MERTGGGWAWLEDLLVAAAVGVVWVAAVLVAEESVYWSPSGIRVYWWSGVCTAIVLALRRQAPAVGFWLAVTAYPVTYWLTLRSDFHVLPVLLAAYAATRAAVVRPFVAATGALGATVLLQLGGEQVLQAPPPYVWLWALDPSRALVLAALACSAVVLGATIHRLADTTAELGARNAELEALQEVRARQAVRQERTRIARDLHDVVAHHVSAMVVRAQAADRVADTHPQAPLEAVRWIAPAGREALDAMRGVVSVLREDDGRPVAHPSWPPLVLPSPPAWWDPDGAAPLAPTPVLDDLVVVLERVVGAGLVVETDLPDPLPVCAPDVGLAIVRITQEALTNVLVHSAAGTTRVRLRVVDEHLVLTVTDPGPARTHSGPSRAGNGAVHMRERAQACGGRVSVGPLGPEGAEGWQVHVVLPRAGLRTAPTEHGTADRLPAARIGTAR